ncbi:unknown function [Vibrio phage D51]
MTKPVLIFDVDGVLLKWESNLPFFARDNGLRLKSILQNYSKDNHVALKQIFGISDSDVAQQLADQYNLSSHGRYLAAFDDAVQHLYRLQEHYSLVVVTSFGSTIEHYTNRCRNLQAFFPNAFEEVICLKHGVNKSDVFEDIERNHGHILGFIDDQIFNLEDISKYAEEKGNEDLARNCIHLNRYAEDAPFNHMSQVVTHFLGEVDVR